MKVAVGDPAPPFTLEDQHSDVWSLEAQRGRPVVLYFYPKDDTPGCTTQARAVRDRWEDFADLDAAVAGISPDDTASHQRFASKHDLPHRLLADPDREVLEAFGAWGEKQRGGETVMGVIRSSVVIDPDGKVAAVFDTIQPDEQADRSLEVVRGLLEG